MLGWNRDGRRGEDSTSRRPGRREAKAAISANTRTGVAPRRLLDFLVAQRNYDAIELAYRPGRWPAYLTSVEQLRQGGGKQEFAVIFLK